MVHDVDHKLLPKVASLSSRRDRQEGHEFSVTVPLPSSVREALAAYLVKYPATTVELPWETPDSDKLVRVALVLSTRERSALNRNYFNTYIWKKALAKTERQVGS